MVSAMPTELPPLPLSPRIGAATLRRALVAGMRRLLERRDWLNRINVFPVPDGDTGSNLAFTVAGVLGHSLARPCRSSGELLQRVADDAIDGARGNSGAIFAQFLHGLAEAAGRARVLSTAQLAAAARLGAEQAAAALAEPREGTILSVIRAFAQALGEGQAADLRSWFEHALERARQALAETPRQLSVLRQAGVVDAGGQGFVDFLEGIGAFIAGARELPGEDPAQALASTALHADAAPDPARPWCSECLIERDADAGTIDRAALQAALAALDADCVVLAGGRQRLRLHAHVAEPGRLFELAGRFGRVAARKAEDMRMQHRAALAGQPVAVLTDSGADLPAEWLQALDIHMVAARVSFGAEEFLDKVSLSPSEFYARLAACRDLPQTSQPPPGDFRRQFEFLLAHHQAAVYVGLSRAVSGTLQAGEAAAARCPERRATVVDSGHASCGQGLLARAAAELAAGGADAATVAAAVERLRPLTQTWAIARDLGHAVRGGRIPRWSLPLARALGLSPIARVRPDGRLGIAGALFGGHDLPRRFAAFLARRVGAGPWRLLVGHCNAAEDGERLLAELLARLDCRDGWLVEAGPAIGAHAGPGTLVVGLQPVAGSAG